MHSGYAASSCSAWERRSAATHAGCAVSSHRTEDLAGARDAVDADLAIDQALGARDVAVTRTDDFVDFRDAVGAIGEGADGLRATRVEDPSDPREVGRGQQQIVRRGGREDDVTHASDACRYRRHEHAGRVAGFPAGRVDPHPSERALTNPEGDPLFLVTKSLRLLVLVVTRDARRGELESAGDIAGEAKSAPRPSYSRRNSGSGFRFSNCSTK